MRNGRLVSLFVLATLLVVPAAAVATTYTHLSFDVSPAKIPQGGTTTIILSTADNSVVPPGGSNFNCNAPCTFPFVPPGPACPATNFESYKVTQLTVTTPKDPSNPDVYMLGSTSAPGITGSPIVVTKINEPLNVPYGPQGSPFTVNGIQYEWWRIRLNGNPVSPNQNIIAHPTPGPTSLAGTYTIDLEGTMQCFNTKTDFTQNFFFDIGFQITTPEFGSVLMVVGLGALAIVFLKKKAISPKIV